MRYLFFITIFIVLFSIPCFSRTCKILCTIVSPFLTQPGLLVMGGCIIGWVSSVVQLPSVCASTLSGTHVFRFRAVYIAERIITEPRSGKLYGGRFLYEVNPRELTAIPSKISVLEIIHHDVSKLSELSPVFDLTWDLDLIRDHCDNALISLMDNATTLSGDGQW